MATYFETKRLIFRDWTASDFIPFAQMNSDREVMRYFPSVLSQQVSADLLRRIEEEFAASGYGLYAVELKENGEFIGFTGFHRATFEADFTPCIEIGWRLRKAYWKQGYATEGASECLRYGFGKLGFDKVYSFTATINTPSERVMQRIGMQKAGTFLHPQVEEGSPLRQHVLYVSESQQ